MYALTPSQLRAMADTIEAMNDGLVGDSMTELAVGDVPITDMEGELIGKISYDENGAYGFIIKKKWGY
jgi:hypothetical protein